jgi:ribosomal protein S30
MTMKVPAKKTSQRVQHLGFRHIYEKQVEKSPQQQFGS